jgi:hypothetical protein
MIAAATAQLDRELASMSAAAAEAEAAFAQSAAGQRAALRWHAGQETPGRLAEIEAYEQTSAALVQGIAHPVYVLESACVWLLQAGGAHGG